MWSDDLNVGDLFCVMFDTNFRFMLETLIFFVKDGLRWSISFLVVMLYHNFCLHDIKIVCAFFFPPRVEVESKSQYHDIHNVLYLNKWCHVNLYAIITRIWGNTINPFKANKRVHIFATTKSLSILTILYTITTNKDFSIWIKSTQNNHFFCCKWWMFILINKTTTCFHFPTHHKF